MKIIINWEYMLLLSASFFIAMSFSEENSVKLALGLLSGLTAVFAKTFEVGGTDGKTLEDELDG